MSNRIPKLRTVRVVAEDLGVSIWRVRYLLKKHAVKPVGRAGSLRVFSKEAVEILRAILGR
jgi:DNA-binding transcriptional MerR regulator